MSDYIFGVARPGVEIPKIAGIATITSKGVDHIVYSYHAIKNDPHAVSDAYRIPKNQSVAFIPSERWGGIQVIHATDVYLLPADYSEDLHTKLKDNKHMQVIEIWVLNGLLTSLAGPADVLKTLNDGKSVAKKFKVIIDLMTTTEDNIREFISRNVQGVAPDEIALHEFYQHNHLCLEDKWHHFCFHSTH